MYIVKEKCIVELTSATLVLFSSIQRTKNEEMFTEYDNLLLPLFTILGFSLIILMIEFIDLVLLNFIFLYSFSFMAFFCLASNIRFFFEFFEFHVKEKMLHLIEYSSSSFEEIMIREQTGVKMKYKVKKQKAKNIFDAIYRFFETQIIEFLHSFKTFGIMDIIIYLFSFFVIVMYVYTDDYFLNHLLIISFCFSTIRVIKFDSTITGLTHLALLFIYDVFWFFEGEIITKHLSELDTPIKFSLFKSLKVFELIGLGDILIPGIYIQLVKNYGTVHKCNYNWILTYIFYLTAILISIAISKIRQKNFFSMFLVCPIIALGSFVMPCIQQKAKCFFFFERLSPKMAKKTEIKKG